MITGHSCVDDRHIAVQSLPDGEWERQGAWPVCVAAGYPVEDVPRQPEQLHPQ